MEKRQEEAECKKDGKHRNSKMGRSRIQIGRSGIQKRQEAPEFKKWENGKNQNSKKNGRMELFVTIFGSKRPVKQKETEPAFPAFTETAHRIGNSVLKTRGRNS